MGDQEIERKKKIALLIILVLTEKARKLSKSKSSVHEIIALAIEILFWMMELKKLIRAQKLNKFKRGCTIVGSSNDIIIKNLWK